MHGPGASQAWGDGQAGRPAGVAGPQGSTWRARSFAIPDRVNLAWWGPWNSGPASGPEARVTVEVFQIVGDQFGGRAHQGQVPGFGSLPWMVTVAGVAARMSATVRSQSSGRGRRCRRPGRRSTVSRIARAGGARFGQQRLTSSARRCPSAG